MVFALCRRPLDGCNYHEEGPQIYPKFAPHANRGRSAFSQAVAGSYKGGMFARRPALVLSILPLGGVFAQRAHSANYYGDYPGNNPENHPPAESCTINSKLKNSNI